MLPVSHRKPHRKDAQYVTISFHFLMNGTDTTLQLAPVLRFDALFSGDREEANSSSPEQQAFVFSYLTYQPALRCASFVYRAPVCRYFCGIVEPTTYRMSLALTFSALRAKRPGATFIVWTRMDQKSCFKAIVAAGFTPIVVENLIEASHS